MLSSHPVHTSFPALSKSPWLSILCHFPSFFDPCLFFISPFPFSASISSKGGPLSKQVHFHQEVKGFVPPLPPPLPPTPTPPSPIACICRGTEKEIWLIEVARLQAQLNSHAEFILQTTSWLDAGWTLASCSVTPAHGYQAAPWWLNYLSIGVWCRQTAWFNNY